MTVLIAQKAAWLPVSMPDYADLRLVVMFTVAALVGILVYALSPRLVAYCRRMGAVAQVTERSSHTVPTPIGGGAILPMVVVPVGLALTWLWPLPFKGYLSVLLLGSLLVAYVGWLDDKHELSPRLRLFTHLFAVAITLFLLPQLFDFMPLWLEKLVLLFGWAWFVNLFNFMDGADGLATSQAIALGLGLSVVVPAFAPIGLMFAAACTGFLRVNGPPAKVFMGDVSSTWLGFVIAGLFLLAAVDDTMNVVWPLATLPLVFAADATTTLIRRILQGHKPWQPHKTFWFHRYLAQGHSHANLVGRVALLNLVLFLIGWLAYLWHAPVVGFLLGLLVICAAACYIRAREKALHRGLHQAKSSRGNTKHVRHHP